MVPPRTKQPGAVDLPGPDWQWRVRLHAWRERLRSNPATRTAYRWTVAIIGLCIVVLGAILIPFPGPGWLIVFLGIGVWSSEFHWAGRLLTFGRRQFDRWMQWMSRRGWAVRGLVGLGCWLVVLALFWALFRVTGVPAWLPDAAEDALRQYGGL